MCQHNSFCTCVFAALRVLWLCCNKIYRTNIESYKSEFLDVLLLLRHSRNCHYTCGFTAKKHIEKLIHDINASRYNSDIACWYRFSTFTKNHLYGKDHGKVPGRRGNLP